MKKYLLVNPWIYDFAAHNFGVVPVGLLRIASLLQKHHEVQLLDCLAGCRRAVKETGFSKFRKEKMSLLPKV